MKNDIVSSAEIVSRFCRLHINMKREIPIRPSEMGALIYVQKSGEPVTPVMISNFFGVSKPSVTDMVNSLINKDYLIKTPSDIDKRSYTVTVTEKGQQLLELTFKEYVKTIELLEKKMGTKEFELLMQLLEKANSVLSEETEG